MEHAVIEKANPIALSEDQKTALNKYKIQARKDNEIFLRQHPEVSCLISDFLHEVLLQRPEQVVEFAANHFTQPDIRTRINSQIKEEKKLLRREARNAAKSAKTA